MSNIKIATDELHNAFELLNKTFFDNGLPNLAITIQSSGKRNSMGWCTTKEVWGDRDGRIKLYEINIAAEFLDLDFYETMDTLMHEMVHLYNIIHTVRDCSRGGTYHNKKFKAEAERRGFYFESDKPDKKYGWYNPRLTEETKQLISTLDINKSAFLIARRGMELHRNEEEGNKAEEQKEERKKSYKWVCPGCDLIVRSTKLDVSLKCLECNEELEERD
ncbi:SprT-like domain-containing protein [Cytobacillus sp. FSL K6-0129]|uniref:SprT-like domain-containing protein n=1 Tax=unclassified Cytobacillus TaxID=2675268 RepID=UPI0030F58EB5